MKPVTRFFVVILLSLVVLPLAWAQKQKPLTLEEIFSDPGLTGRMPEQMKWMPDGQQLSYILRDDAGTRGDLWVVNAVTGERRILVSHEQLLQLAPAVEKVIKDERERERLRRYAVASYLWSPDGKVILFSSAGRLFLYDLATQAARPIAPARRDLRDPKFSPDGKWVSFVYEHDIWVVSLTDGEEKQLTRGGSENVLHGELDWVYPEELGIRTGYAWSPDSRRIAFLELDEHPVPTYPIANLVPLASSVDFQKYPKGGDPNPKPRLGIVEVATGKTVWLDRVAEYIPRFQWIDANRLSVQLLNRAQTELELIFADATSARSQTVLYERDPHWINLHNDLKFLKSATEFLWTSERAGFRHIYVYKLDGTLARTLTSGDWEVGEITGVDEANGWVYFTASKRSPLDLDLYRVRLAGGAPELLSESPGTHRIIMNPAATVYADSYSTLTAVPAVSVHDIASKRSAVVHQARAVDAYSLVKPGLVELTTADGALVRGMFLKPAQLEPGKKYPVLIYIYGGPHAPVISNNWGGSRYLFHQYLVQEGFLVFYLDDRVSSIPGHKYEAAISRAYGPAALKDHTVGVNYLKSLPYVDPERIGIWGWSGGGFTTCFHLTHSDLFKVGIAVAPVTDWHLYDSIYTERYMGLPEENPEAYKATSAVVAAANLYGRLLLVHGDADDNVHPQNTFQMIDALIKAGKPYDLLIYPQKTHSIAGSEARIHLFRAMTEYLKKNL